MEKWCADEDVILHTAIQFLTAFAVCFACSLATETPTVNFSGRTLLALVYIKYTTANTSSLILSTEAVFGVAFSMLFYRERPSLQEMIGFAVILAAVLLSELKPGKKTPGR